MFYAHVFCTKFWRQKLQNLNVSKESCAICLISYKKGVRKMLMKLTPDNNNPEAPPIRTTPPNGCSSIAAPYKGRGSSGPRINVTKHYFEHVKKLDHFVNMVKKKL